MGVFQKGSAGAAYRQLLHASLEAMEAPGIQICPGSLGSGSRTGASGLSGGLGGSLIGGGMGSGGVRSPK